MKSSCLTVPTTSKYGHALVAIPYILSMSHNKDVMGSIKTISKESEESPLDVNDAMLVV
jgi:hypothetical protein